METAGAYSGAERGEGETWPLGGLCVSAVPGGSSVERGASGGGQAEGWTGGPRPRGGLQRAGARATLCRGVARAGAGASSGGTACKAKPAGFSEREGDSLGAVMGGGGGPGHPVRPSLGWPQGAEGKGQQRGGPGVTRELSFGCI